MVQNQMTPYPQFATTQPAGLPGTTGLEEYQQSAAAVSQVCQIIRGISTICFYLSVYMCLLCVAVYMVSWVCVIDISVCGCCVYVYSPRSSLFVVECIRLSIRNQRRKEANDKASFASYMRMVVVYGVLCMVFVSMRCVWLLRMVVVYGVLCMVCCV